MRPRFATLLTICAATLAVVVPMRAITDGELMETAIPRWFSC